ncbi:MAG: hypothetical protein OEL89_01560 [Candidatus Peregrinibacteria bacterium]|nr:hypothetical protein [Candidatus Peregrinibacteria bacterium]
MEIISRKCIPTSHELICKNSMKREELDFDFGLKEFSFIKIFYDDELSSEAFDKSLLKRDFENFCIANKGISGIFYPQFTQGKNLSNDEIEIINSMQDTNKSDIRLIHFIRDESFDDFKNRANSFMESNNDKRLIPVMNINVRSKNDLIWLGAKVDYISKTFDECIVNYSNWKMYDEAWKIVSSLLSDINWYIFGLPTSEEGGFSLILYSLLLGANGTSHKMYRGGGNGKPNPPLFINRDLSLRQLDSCDTGFAKYGSKDRIEFLTDDGRTSYVRNFAKWDRIVQANLFCKAHQKVEDLSNIESVKSAIEYFGNNRIS